MVKHTYLVGPRPIYPENPNARFDGCVIVAAESEHETEPAKECAQRKSPALAAHVRAGKRLSAAVIPNIKVPNFIKRGAVDLRS